MNLELMVYWVIPFMLSFLIIISGVFEIIKYFAIYYRVGKAELILNGMFGITFGIWSLAILGGNGLFAVRIISFMLFPIFYAFFVDRTPVEQNGIRWLQRILFCYSIVSMLLLGIILYVDGSTACAFWKLGYGNIVFIMLMAMPGVVIQRKRGLHGWIRILSRAILVIGMSLEAICFWKGLEQFEGMAARIATGLYLLFYNIHLAQETGELVQEHIDSSRAQLEIQRQLMMNQINPHFIFNSLNCILALISKEPQEARDAIYTFAKYLRANFDAMASYGLIRFEQELVQIRAYLKLQQKRFPGQINVSMDFESTDFLIPALTVQQFIENAASYGLSRCNRNGRLFLRTILHQSSVEIQIQLEGGGIPGISGRERQMLAERAESVRLRLSKLPQSEVVWEWKDSGEGNVIITIPTDEKSIVEYENNNCG